MKKISMILSAALVSLSLTAQAESQGRTMQVRGEKARDLMEALAGAGYKMKSGEEFGDQPITVKAHAITCKYSIATFPDEWMSDAECRPGQAPEQSRPVLKNPLALAKALRAVAEAEGAAGSRYIVVTGASCVLSYDAKAYSCEVSQVTYY